MSELQKRIADVLFFQSPAFTKKRQPCYRSEFDPIADKVIAAIGDSGRVVVDRARFERLIEVVKDTIAIIDDIGDLGMMWNETPGAIVSLFELQPGDLEPL